jgi:pyrroline-5-carboxylate reductase
MNTIAFIGGGNMASAIIGGLRRDGWGGDAISVVDPGDVPRARLADVHEVRTLAAADATLVVWAVKPQAFREAAASCAAHLGSETLHLSVMAGIRSDAIARATGSRRIVRAMPNTPALIGRGIAGLYARETVSEGERELIEDVLAPTGRLLWVAREEDLDAVTALSGSGPAYVFYFVEAMMQAAADMGLDAEAGKQLALATFAGAAELALRASEQPHALREQVTSRGGTTQAAIGSMDADGVQAAIVRAVRAAQARAVELGDAFGA